MNPRKFFIIIYSERNSGEFEYQEHLKEWTRETFAKFHSIYRSEVNAEIQICLRTGYLTRYEDAYDPWWKECVFGFRRVNPKSTEAITANSPPACIELWAFTTYIVDCSNYLRWMMKEFLTNCGTIIRRKIDSLNELSTYDIVVNCTGIRAGNLVEEHDMKPCRGQGLLVKAPWISSFMIDERGIDLTYILPRADTIVLGGTAEIGNASEEPDSSTTQGILERCFKLNPSLRKAQILGGWSGLRPLRSRVRLDTETGPTGNVIIHCYGHGGQGIVLSWGCAKDIGDIVQKEYRKQAHL